MLSRASALLACALLGATTADNGLQKAILDNNPAMVNIALKSGDKVNAANPTSGDTPLLGH